jgi:predicted Zn-dependent peptidase
MKNLFTTEYTEVTEYGKSKKERMNRFLLRVLCGSIFFVSPVFAKPPLVPDTAPLEIKIPSFDVKTLSCGLKVIFLKNDDLPLVSVNLSVPGGDARDPQGKEGLVALMSAALRDGGAGNLSPEAFDAALESRAVSMTASADHESFGAGFNCLAGDLPEILQLFADMVLHPQFDLKRLETDKLDSLDALQRLEDTPDELTRVTFVKGFFGQSPYGRWAGPLDVQKITREDVVDFYEKHYGPQGSILAVAGNFDEAAVYSQLESLFSGWKNQEALPPLADAKPLGPTIYFFPKDVSQVFIRYGVLGLKRHDARDIPLQVANYILGGSGFTSRLMQQIRSDRGLAYFVDSVSMPYDIRGLFEVIGGTRPDSVKEYLTVMFQVMGDFAKDGPTEGELAQAQRSMVEEYAYNFESPYTLATYRAALDFHGYPDDYLSTYRDQVKAVTREQATQAASDILSEKDWVMVVCGPAALEADLSSFGKVVKVTSIFDPLPANP